MIKRESPTLWVDDMLKIFDERNGEAHNDEVTRSIRLKRDVRHLVDVAAQCRVVLQHYCATSSVRAKDRRLDGMPNYFMPVGGRPGWWCLTPMGKYAAAKLRGK